MKESQVCSNLAMVYPLQLRNCLIGYSGWGQVQVAASGLGGAASFVWGSMPSFARSARPSRQSIAIRLAASMKASRTHLSFNKWPHGELGRSASGMRAADAPSTISGRSLTFRGGCARGVLGLMRGELANGKPIADVKLLANFMTGLRRRLHFKLALDMQFWSRPYNSNCSARRTGGDSGWNRSLPAAPRGACGGRGPRKGRKTRVSLGTAIAEVRGQSSQE